jgi:hypothetical protein
MAPYEINLMRPRSYGQIGGPTSSSDTWQTSALEAAAGGVEKTPAESVKVGLANTGA